MNRTPTSTELATMEAYKVKTITRLALFVLIFLLIVLIMTLLVSCEPSPEITFDNQQNQEVRIFQAHLRDDGTIDGFVEQGTISAHSTKIIHMTFLGNEWINRIELRDTFGNVVLSHDYKMADLKKLDWKIVIQAP